MALLAVIDFTAKVFEFLNDIPPVFFLILNESQYFLK